MGSDAFSQARLGCEVLGGGWACGGGLLCFVGGGVSWVVEGGGGWRGWWCVVCFCVGYGGHGELD